MYYRILGFNKVKEQGLPVHFKSTLKLTSLDRLAFEHPKIVDFERQTIQFLNQPEPFDINNFDWSPSQRSRLWRYHLHYFDYLFQPDLPYPHKAHLITDWIHKNPQGAEPAWEPYTTSLRIVNWVIYFSGSKVPDEWNQSLYLQTRWLYSNLEYHILANHYFENLKAILFSACYFASGTDQTAKEVQRWKAFSVTYLQRELEEQFFTDGGHYERSPQYHNVMIKNCIEILCLLNDSNLSSLPITNTLRQIIRNGLSFSQRIMRQDGKIPLFNDSSFDQTPNNSLLSKMAADLALISPKTTTEASPDVQVVSENQSGIYGIKTDRDWLMIDCGDVGPNYQPGHTHCDFLSYELVLNNVPVVVDSGVYEYEDTHLRRQLRSTQSHNTVSVDGLEQSQLWSSFRVARRAKKLAARIWKEASGFVFEGAYVGFNRWRFKATHTRRMEIKLSESNSEIKNLCVTDNIAADSDKPTSFSSYIHLHPNLTATPQDKLSYLISLNGRPFVILKIGMADAIRIETGIYAPEFGLKFPTVTFVLQSHGNPISYEFLQICDSNAALLENKF